MAVPTPPTVQNWRRYLAAIRFYQVVPEAHRPPWPTFWAQWNRRVIGPTRPNRGMTQPPPMDMRLVPVRWFTAHIYMGYAPPPGGHGGTSGRAWRSGTYYVLHYPDHAAPIVSIPVWPHQVVGGYVQEVFEAVQPWTVNSVTTIALGRELLRNYVGVAVRNFEWWSWGLP